MGKKKGNVLFKIMVAIFILATSLGLILHIYNANIEKKTIEKSLSLVKSTLKSNTEYIKESNRIIAEIYHIKNERELFILLKSGLPRFSEIGENNIINSLSIRVYYNGDKNNFQYYDIKFNDIRKIDWEKVDNFEKLLTFSNVYLK